MELSLQLIARSHHARPELLVAAAQAAEATGLSCMWFGDHVAYPVEYTTRYPGHPSGRLPFDLAAPQLDTLLALTWVAAATTRLRLGTAVLVLPMRNPVLLAKELATLDVLSNGRVRLGVGLGWLREEFESCQVGAVFGQRGRRTDEYVRAMEALWTQEEAEFEGEFVSFPPTYCSPKPVQPDGPPIWIGGYGPAAHERVARYGAGWITGGRVTIEEMTVARTAIARRAEQLGRDPDAIGVVAQGVRADDPVALAARLEGLADAGVDEASVLLEGRTPEEAQAFVHSLERYVHH
jgi:probable F420-dependent oxidoreductase